MGSSSLHDGEQNEIAGGANPGIERTLDHISFAKTMWYGGEGGFEPMIRRSASFSASDHAPWRTIFRPTPHSQGKTDPSRRLNRDGERVITKVVAGIGFEPMTFRL